MICPRCGAEFREGIRECSDCNVPLADPRGSAAPDRRLLGESPGANPDVELVTVFRSGDATQLMVAESILRSAEVPYVTRGAGVQELFGLGRFPAGMSMVVGPVELLVRREDARDAGDLLEDLISGDHSSEELEWSDDDLAEGEGEEL